MSKLDSTDTYLNLNANQFNTWIKEFEVKYQEIENNTNVKNNLEIFNNSINNSEECESDESDEVDSDDESSNVFIADQKVSNTSSTKGNKFLYNKSVTRLRKSIISDTPTSTKKNLISSESSSMERKPPTNKKNLTSSESSSIEQKIMNRKNRPEYNTEHPFTEPKIDEILSLKQLNNMIPVFNNRSTKVNTRVGKNNVEDEDIKISTNNQKKLGDHALYKFIINRRR